jgi:hypothetical protein
VPVALLAGALLPGALYLLAGPYLPGGAGELARALPYATALAVALAACSLLIALALRRRDLRQAFAAVALAAIVASVYVVTGIESLRRQDLTERSFAAEIKQRYPGSKPICFSGTGGRIRYYLGPGPVTGSLEEVKALLDADPDGVLILCDAEGKNPIEQSSLFQATELLRATSPAIGPVVKAKERYFLFRLEKR